MAGLNHLDGHPHAFIDATGTVLNVAAFDGHDADLIPLILEAQPDAVAFVCCCLHGPAGIGDTWTGDSFQPPQQ